MPFGLYIANERGPVETSHAKLSEALRLGEMISLVPHVNYVAVVNDSRHTVAAFQEGVAANLLSLEEEAAVAAGKCRLSPKGCPDPNGPMGYCINHFRDLVIYGDPGNRTVRRPESLAAVGALRRDPSRPRVLDDANMARAYELIHENPGKITAKFLADEFGVTTTLIYRRIPALRRPAASERLSESRKAQGYRMLDKDPDITVTEFAERLGISTKTARKHFPEIRDARRTLGADDIAAIQQMKENNPRISLTALAKQFRVSPPTVKYHLQGDWLSDQEISRGDRLIREGYTMKDIGAEFNLSPEDVKSYFSVTFRAAQSRESRKSGPKSETPNRASATTRDEFPAPPLGNTAASPLSSARRTAPHSGPKEQRPKR